MALVMQMMSMLLQIMAFELPHVFCFLFLLLLLQHLLLSTTAQTNTNISLGSSIAAQDSNYFWASPSGEFAFGFQEIGSHGYLVAIWFNKIPEKTIVWSANGDNLVGKGSIVELTPDGQLLLNDSRTGKQTWIAHFADSSGVAYAAMLDTGNFVLADHNSVSMWKTFDRPTDTILPTQTLRQINMNILVARYTPTNHSRGRFQFAILPDGPDGFLALYATHFPFGSVNFVYIYWGVSDAYQVIFNQSAGSVDLAAKNGSVLHVVLNNTVSMQDFYHRATLEYNGVMRHYVYPKKESRTVRKWSSLSSIPENICLAVADIGGGACGFNSLCSHDDQGEPICQCPKGYTFIDQHDVLQGCKQDFISQSCVEDSSEIEAFYLDEIQNASWKNDSYDFIRPVDEEWCKQSCLADCFCSAVIYYNGNCEKRSIPLSNGRIAQSVGWKTLIKIRKENSTLTPRGRDSEKKDNSSFILVGTSLVLSSLLCLNLLLLVVIYLVVTHSYSGRTKATQPSSVMPGMSLKCFTYEELNEATKGFKEEVGRGAFATIFKGVLASDNGKCIAVKRLDTRVEESDLEFKVEISAIGRTNHRNLVQLLGFCNEGKQLLLVYEFMSNGSLAGFLFGEWRPNWYQRSQIALGVARGLLYLHEECSSQIIHCDIKPQNILLDDSFTARIADFGLAKLLRSDQIRTTTRIRGTRGYVAPEWYKNIPITVKVDVYSYGIMLLETICCRKNFEEHAEDEDQMILSDWAYDCCMKKKLHLLVEKDDEVMDDIEKFVMIAIWCIQEDPELRPTMKKVTQMLEETVKVSVPPEPSSSTSSI